MWIRARAARAARIPSRVLTAALPAGFSAPIAIIRNWTFAVFYTMAELWGSVVVSLLFWGFANEVTSVKEAKKYYPLFGLGANVALIFSGQVRARVPPGGRQRGEGGPHRLRTAGCIAMLARVARC